MRGPQTVVPETWESHADQRQPITWFDSDAIQCVCHERGSVDKPLSLQMPQGREELAGVVGELFGDLGIDFAFGGELGQ